MIMNPKCRNACCEHNKDSICVCQEVSITNTGECETYWLSVAAGRSSALEEKSCYDCGHFSLCRLRDRAGELQDYFNKTGNFMGSDFSEKLYKLMGASCSWYYIAPDSTSLRLVKRR